MAKPKAKKPTLAQKRKGMYLGAQVGGAKDLKKNPRALKAAEMKAKASVKTKKKVMAKPKAKPVMKKVTKRVVKKTPK
jgi:hypothetical protein